MNTVAKKIRDAGVDIKIVLMESNLNEVENVHVKRTPTLRLYPKGDKSSFVEVIARDLEEHKLIDWLRENSAAFKAKGGDI